MKKSLNNPHLPPSLLEHAVIQNWKNGETIHMWTSESGIFYVLYGTVYIIQLLENGGRSILHVVEKDRFFFENRYFHPHTRISAAYAVSDTQTAYFTPEKIEFLLNTSLEFCKILIYNMALKNLNSGKNILNSRNSNPEIMVLNALYDLLLQKKDSNSNSLRITQATLAEYVGRHPVTTNKILKLLERKGLITLGRGVITMNLTHDHNA
ncbi:MAG: Crp/Fnr family transcriptional regulator [Desulfovibrionaceae bacterium]|nr:Crp/Fnr family transcriptional regulator [Desulfovibrionaceae bacterium]